MPAKGDRPAGRFLLPGCRPFRVGETTVSSTVPGVTEPDATGPSLATIGAQDTPWHAGQFVRRVLLRRNIVIEGETAQLVVVAV